MDDNHDTDDAGSQFERAELVGLIGNAYVRRGLSPPSQLYGAVKRWLGLTHGEILGVIEAHFDQHRQRYRSGSGDGNFHLVEADIRRTWQAKHPPFAPDDEPVRPQRRRAGRVRQIQNAAGGRPDVLVEGQAAREVRRSVRPTADLSGYTAEPRVGVANLEDDVDADA
jgi:hypothetical protein